MPINAIFITFQCTICITVLFEFYRRIMHYQMSHSVNIKEKPKFCIHVVIKQFHRNLQHFFDAEIRVSCLLQRTYCGLNAI